MNYHWHVIVRDLSDSFALLARINITGYFIDFGFTLYFGATVYIALGVLTIFKPNKLLWITKALFVLLYTVVISIWLPEFWLHPFGPILKNIPFITCLWLFYQYQEATS